MQWYATWFDSPFYHLLYDHRSEEEARGFIRNLLEYLDVPKGSAILDLACGSGRHSRQMAQMGMRVTGVDLSPASITQAKEMSCGRDQYFIHDMRQPFTFGTFDYILNLFTSFGYFEKEAEHQNVLRHIQHALNPKGIFVMDFLSAPYVEAGLVKAETVHKAGIDFHIQRKIERGFIYKEIRFKSKGQDYFFIERVRAYTKEELGKMFQLAGLELLESFGDYQLQPYQEALSPRLILTATH